jgi:high-affinity Fe2+/Pb2+ permease
MATVSERRTVPARNASQRLTTETKHATKTTEFFAMIAAIAGILIAAWYVGRNGGADYFKADKAWLYVAIVASAYMISRGLAKSGSREPYWDDADTDR